MKYHELLLKRHKSPSRKGRGISSGQGKTAGRGTKGQNSRAGGKVRPGFEGGQNPLILRIPKLKGFKRVSRTQVIQTGMLNSLSGKVDNRILYEKKLIKNPYHPVKLIFNGRIESKIELSVQAFSQNAAKAVEKAGGSIKQVSILKQSSKVNAEKD